MDVIRKLESIFKDSNSSHYGVFDIPVQPTNIDIRICSFTQK